MVEEVYSLVATAARLFDDLTIYRCKIVVSIATVSNTCLPVCLTSRVAGYVDLRDVERRQVETQIQYAKRYARTLDNRPKAEQAI